MKQRVFVVVGLASLASVLVVALWSWGLLRSTDAATTPSRDADAVALAALSQHAFQRAAAVVSNPVLHQVDVFPPTGRTIFYFTDPVPTREIDVDVPASDAAPDQWHVRSAAPSKFVLGGYRAPALNMTALQVGAGSVIRALAHQWSGCTATSVTLFRKGDDLEWTGFCRLPDGRVATGTTDNRTGEFHPSPAPPAYPPIPALPK